MIDYLSYLSTLRQLKPGIMCRCSGLIPPHNTISSVINFGSKTIVLHFPVDSTGPQNPHKPKILNFLIYPIKLLYGNQIQEKLGI